MMRKNVGTVALFPKSHKNTRTKIPVTPFGVTGIFCAEMGLESLT